MTQWILSCRPTDYVVGKTRSTCQDHCNCCHGKCRCASAFSFIAQTQGILESTGGRSHAWSTTRISIHEWRDFHRDAKHFQNLLIIKTWGLIGSRMKTEFISQFSFQENLCLQTRLWFAISSEATDFFFFNSETPEIFSLTLIELRYSGDILHWLIPIFRYNGMGKGHHKGHCKGKWKQRDEERLQRTPELDARYNAPTPSTATTFGLSP